jgi:hypothetical protein
MPPAGLPCSLGMSNNRFGRAKTETRCFPALLVISESHEVRNLAARVDGFRVGRSKMRLECRKSFENRPAKLWHAIGTPKNAPISPLPGTDPLVLEERVELS